MKEFFKKFLVLFAMLSVLAPQVAQAAPAWMKSEYLTIPGCEQAARKSPGEDAWAVSGPATIKVAKGYTFYLDSKEYTAGTSFEVASGQKAYFAFNDRVSGAVAPKAVSAPTAPPTPTPAPVATIVAGLSDISSHWGRGFIETGVKAGFISGYPDGTFRPNGTITRGEFSSIVANYFGYKYAGTSSNHWASKFVGALAEAKVLPPTWVSLGELDIAINREEVAYILAQSFGLSSESNKSFTDSGLVSLFARESVQILAAEGILNGYPDGSFKPQGSISRAEATTMMVGASEKWYKTTYPIRVFGLESEIFIKDGDSFKAILSKDIFTLPAGVKLHGTLKKGQKVSLELDSKAVTKLPVPAKALVGYSLKSSTTPVAPTPAPTTTAPTTSARTTIDYKNWKDLKSFTFFDRQWIAGNDDVFTFYDTKHVSFKVPEGMTIYAENSSGKWETFEEGSQVSIKGLRGSATMSFRDGIFDFSLFKNPVWK